MTIPDKPLCGKWTLSDKAAFGACVLAEPDLFDDGGSFVIQLSH